MLISLCSHTGAISGTDKWPHLLRAWTASGTLSVGAIADADSLTTLSLTSANANLTVGAIGGTGTGEVLSSVTVSATGSSTTTVGNITADTTDSATDNAMVITVTTETGSTATFGAINNQYGSIAVTASGDGTHNLGVSGSSTATAVTQTFDLTGATGTNVVETVGVTGTAAVTLAVGQGADTVTVGGNGGVTITNFQTGTGKDQLDIDISDAFSVLIQGNSTHLTAGDTPVITEVTGAATLANTSSVIVLTGTNFATAALAEAAIENNGSMELKLPAANTANDDIIIVWSDGSNSYVGAYNITSSATNPLTGDLSVLAQLDGVVASTASTLHADNFDFV